MVPAGRAEPTYRSTNTCAWRVSVYAAIGANAATVTGESGRDEVHEYRCRDGHHRRRRSQYGQDARRGGGDQVAYRGTGTGLGQRPAEQRYQKERQRTLDHERERRFRYRPGDQERVRRTGRAEEPGQQQVPAEAQQRSGQRDGHGQDRRAGQRVGRRANGSRDAPGGCEGHDVSSPGAMRLRRATSPSRIASSTPVGPAPTSPYMKSINVQVRMPGAARSKNRAGSTETEPGRRRRRTAVTASAPSRPPKARIPTVPCSLSTCRYWLCGESSGSRRYPEPLSSTSLPADRDIGA